MPKGLWLILPAAFIDLAGAGISWALMAFGGTLIGGLAGCAAGASVAGRIGCGFGTLVGATGGTLLNGTLSLPFGIVLGYAIQVCLGLTFGVAFIILPLAMMGMIYPKYLFLDAGKLVPVLGWLPFWTAFVIVSVSKKRADEKKRDFAKSAIAIARVIAPPGSSTRDMLSFAKKMQDIRPSSKNYESAAA